MDKQQRLLNAITEICGIVNSVLDEHQRRLICGSLAKGYGQGGEQLIASLSKMDPRTIRAGISELESIDFSKTTTMISKEGGDRKSTIENDPNLLKTLTEIIEENTNPETVLSWTNLSLSEISNMLRERSIYAGKNVVSSALDQLGYSKQANKKIPQEIFKYINCQAEQFLSAGYPVIYFDGNRKELISCELDNVAPYEIFVQNERTAFINLGNDYNPSCEINIESLRLWWNHIGKINFPATNRILIICEGNLVSKGWQMKLWKYQIALLAEELGLEICICHLPPGIIRFNKIKHMLYYYTPKSFEGKSLTDTISVIKLISNLTESDVLKVDCIENTSKYESTLDDDFKIIDIERVGPYDNIFYTIRGFKK